MKRFCLLLCCFAAGLLVFTPPLRATPLPADQPWMETLRGFLGTFREDDFAFEFQPVTYEPSWVDTTDKAYPVWMALTPTVPHQPALPLKALPVFAMAPGAFLLTTIEGGEDGPRMAFSKGHLITPMPLLWWAEWDYPGNPYHGNKALLNRAFVLAACDLILSDALIRSGTSDGKYAARTSFVGGRLVWQAYTYLCYKKYLPAEVAKAYEQGLIQALTHLEKRGPDTLTDNMNGKTLPAMVYLAQGIDDPQIRKRAMAYAARICGDATTESARQHPAGVIRDATGIEASYNGLYLHFLAWAAAADDAPMWQEALARNYRFKNLLTLPEPDGATAYGPSHFNVRVAHDPANDQWWSILREMTAAMISPQAHYLLSGPRYRMSREVLFPSLEEMQTAIEASITRLNSEPRHNAPKRDLTRFDPFPAKEDGAAWVAYLPFFTKYYRPGTYERLRALAYSDQPEARPFAQRGEHHNVSLPEGEIPMFEEDSESFFIASRPSYHLVVFTGRLGHRHPYMNWGGGGISAFWTPQTGSVILGRSAGYRNNSWSQWRIWPVNALSGTTEFKDAFSTALLRRSGMKVAHETEGENGVSTVEARLHYQEDQGKIFQRGQLGELSGENVFERKVEALPDEVRVTLRLRSDGGDQLAELFEAIPVFLKDSRWQKEVEPTRIELGVGEQWHAATPDYTPGVTRIRLSRFQGAVEILLDRPRPVRLSPEAWAHAESGSEMHVRNLQIDLLDGAKGPAPFSEGEVVYRIRALGKE